MRIPCDAVAEAAAAAGLRACCAQTVLKYPAPDAASFEDALARAREFITRWQGHRLIAPAVAPHAPYTCTVEILRSCAELAGELDVPLHIHLSETALEVEQSRREHGMPVIDLVSADSAPPPVFRRVTGAHRVPVGRSRIEPGLLGSISCARSRAQRTGSVKCGARRTCSKLRSVASARKIDAWH